MPHRITCRDLNELVPYVRVRAEQWIQRCQAAGLDVRVSETYRSDARQAYLYEQKLSTVKVTGAHGFRVALDFFFVESGKTAYPTAKMTAAAQIAKSLGFEWGGDWTSFRDMPHLQMLGGLSLAQYRTGKRPSWYEWPPKHDHKPEQEHTPVHEKEDDEVSQEEFERRFDEMMAKRATKPPNTWAKDAWDAASKLPSVGDPDTMVVNGKNPQGYITREEYIVTQERLGVIPRQPS